MKKKYIFIGVMFSSFLLAQNDANANDPFTKLFSNIISKSPTSSNLTRQGAFRRNHGNGSSSKMAPSNLKTNIQNAFIIGEDVSSAISNNKFTNINPKTINEDIVTLKKQEWREMAGIRREISEKKIKVEASYGHVQKMAQKDLEALNNLETTRMNNLIKFEETVETLRNKPEELQKFIADTAARKIKEIYIEGKLYHLDIQSKIQDKTLLQFNEKKFIALQNKNAELTDILQRNRKIEHAELEFNTQGSNHSTPSQKTSIETSDYAKIEFNTKPQDKPPTLPPKKKNMKTNLDVQSQIQGNKQKEVNHTTLAFNTSEKTSISNKNDYVKIKKDNTPNPPRRRI